MFLNLYKKVISIKWSKKWKLPNYDTKVGIYINLIFIDFGPIRIAIGTPKDK